MHNQARKQLQSKYALATILFLSVLLRIAAAIYLGNEVVALPGTADQISYHQLALRLRSGYGFSFGENWWPLTRAGQPTAHWSYLYTLFLALMYKVFGPNPLAVRLLQAFVVGIVQPYLAYLLGIAVFDRRVGLIYAGLTAGYAYFIYYTATLMTEPFYILAVMASLYLVVRLSSRSESVDDLMGSRQIRTVAGYAGLGVVLGVTVLLRQVFLLVVPIIFLFIFWARRKQSIQGLGLTAVIMLLMILPFTFFNYIRFDRFVLLNTNAGYAFFWANHPIHGTRFQSILSPEFGSYQDLIPPELWHLDEAALDQALLRRGLEFVFEDPIRYLLLTLSRIPAYFKFWPSHGSSLISNISRVASFGVFFPWMIMGIIGAAGRRKSDEIGSVLGFIILLVFCLVYTGIHLLSWALIRYRLPVDAMLLVFAAFGILQFGMHLRSTQLKEAA